MASKYKRGKRIKTIADYYKSTEKGQRMFWIYQGRWLVRHIGWLESMQYRTLKMYIDHYHLYEAILKENMIDIKPPEEEKPTNLFYQQLENGITDLQKFKNLMIEVGIVFEQQGFELWIDSHYSDGKDGFIIKFYEDGAFKEFDYIGLRPENAQTKELHEISNTLKEILREMRKRKV